MSVDWESLNQKMKNIVLNSKLSCSNGSETATPCQKSGSLACKDCRLVVYCCKRCQTAHWPIHRKDCKSPLMKKSWEPSWAKEGRMPAFVGYNMNPQVKFGTLKYLWGNVPAIDIIRLEQNEGNDFPGQLCMLFAASGDIRNVILSVASLPQSYRRPLDIVVNDKEMDIVARNIILLLIFLVEEDPIAAAQHAIHVWYSSLITESCRTLLRDKIKPMIKEVCDKIAQKPRSSLFGKAWLFGNVSLRVVLTRDNWFAFLSYFDVPQGLTKDGAQSVRQGVMLAPERVDYVERALCTNPPPARLCMAKFRADGILLPFGQSRGDFTVPNPTFFSSTTEWPMMDSADPTAGWSLQSFPKFDIGPASNDMYGKLYHYLVRLFVDFYHRLRYSPMSLEFLHLDARLLPEHVGGRRFDRIEVSNITDRYYLGVGETLNTFGPMLQPTGINRHATLVTLFLNAVMEIVELGNLHLPFGPSPEAEDETLQLQKVLSYMPELRHPSTTNLIKITAALGRVRDVDQYFNRYMILEDFASVALESGLQMKPFHTIIDPWPMRIGETPTAKTRKDFELLLASPHTGQERYVEWRLTAGQGLKIPETVSMCLCI